jgi:hypothetical protein
MKISMGVLESLENVKKVCEVIEKLGYTVLRVEVELSEVGVLSEVDFLASDVDFTIFWNDSDNEYREFTLKLSESEDVMGHGNIDYFSDDFERSIRFAMEDPRVKKIKEAKKVALDESLDIEEDLF